MQTAAEDLVLNVALPRLARHSDSVLRWIRKARQKDAPDLIAELATLPGAEGLARLAAMSASERKQAIEHVEIPPDAKARLRRIAKALEGNGAPSSPQSALRRAYPNLDAREGPEEAAVSDLLSRADRALREYDYATATREYRRAFSHAERTGDRALQGRALKGLGDSFWRQHEHLEASKRYEQALELFEQIGDRLGQANTLRALGDLHSFHNDHTQALARYSLALELYEQTDARQGQANTLRALGDLHSFHNDHTQALARYSLALELYEQIGDRLGQAHTLQALGELDSFHKDHAQALARYALALELYEQIGDRLGQANTLLALGDLRSAMGEPKGALESWQKAGEIYEKIGERLGQANVLQSIGLRYLLVEGLRDQGNQMLQGALQLYQAIGAQSGQANVGIALAQDAARHGDLEAAISYLQPVAEFGKRISHPLAKEHQRQIDEWRRRLEAGE